MSVMKCTAAGDCMVFRRLPGHYEGFEELKNFIGQGDFRFFNLETTVHNYESYGAAISGGSWFCARPEILQDMKEFGFNVTTTANNHAMDYSHKGLLKTMEYLRAAGLPFSGTGENLGEASAPCYLDTLSGRFALISVCSSFHDDAPAGEQSRTMPGRPGLNPLHFSTTYRLPKEDMETMRRIAGEIGINGASDISRKEGYLPQLPADMTAFGSLMFKEGEKAGKETKVNEQDMKRIERSIREARFMADYIVISVHSHQLKGTKKEEPDSALEEFAHRCIDAGADAVIGTGPHLLRPVEIYKGRPIFYCLGDFIIQLETVERAPADFFMKQKMTGNEGLDELFNARSDFGKRGLYYSRVMFEAVVPYWEAENGKLTKLQLMPVELHFDEPKSTGGWPSPKADAGILERLQKMSEPYGTKMTIENGIATVAL